MAEELAIVAPILFALPLALLLPKGSRTGAVFSIIIMVAGLSDFPSYNRIYSAGKIALSGEVNLENRFESTYWDSTGSGAIKGDGIFLFPENCSEPGLAWGLVPGAGKGGVAEIYACSGESGGDGVGIAVVAGGEVFRKTLPSSSCETFSISLPRETGGLLRKIHFFAEKFGDCRDEHILVKKISIRKGSGGSGPEGSRILLSIPSGPGNWIFHPKDGELSPYLSEGKLFLNTGKNCDGRSEIFSEIFLPYPAEEVELGICRSAPDSDSFPDLYLSIDSGARIPLFAGEGCVTRTIPAGLSRGWHEFEISSRETNGTCYYRETGLDSFGILVPKNGGETRAT